MPSLTPSGSSTSSPSPPPSTSTPLSPSIGIGLFAAIALTLAIWTIAWAVPKQPATAVADKDLESRRIVYGFWLIIAALILTLLVLVVILTAFAPAEPKTTDIVAIITAVTGVIGTLTAAFFGIQAAGAGRSQAMSVLSDQMKSQGAGTDGASNLEPAYGPHAGGTRVSITGNGFTGANAANFGATPGTNFKCTNDGLVQVTSPKAPDGTNDAKVMVIFPGSSPTNRVVGTFYYYTIENEKGDPRPHGPGGEKVWIRGTELATVNVVKFGATPATGQPEYKDGRLSIMVPAGKAGTNVDVSVIFPVDAPLTNSFVVGNYHYDEPTAPNPS